MKVGPVLKTSDIQDQGQQRRLVSFTFDDGLEYGARTACEVLETYNFRGSFYPVTGWVAPMSFQPREPFNRGLSHADWSFWRRLAARGHEVGSHTMSHFRLGGRRAMVSPLRLWREIDGSYSRLVEEMGEREFMLSAPWNTRSRLADLMISQRFLGCLSGTDRLHYNRPPFSTCAHLTSWAPPRLITPQELANAATGMPPNSWLIFQFHSFEGEGYEPQTIREFSKLCATIADQNDIMVTTVKEGLLRFKGRDDASTCGVGDKSSVR